MLIIPAFIVVDVPWARKEIVLEAVLLEALQEWFLAGNSGGNGSQ